MRIQQFENEVKNYVDYLIRFYYKDIEENSNIETSLNFLYSVVTLERMKKCTADIIPKLSLDKFGEAQAFQRLLGVALKKYNKEFVFLERNFIESINSGHLFDHYEAFRLIKSIMNYYTAASFANYISIHLSGVMIVQKQQDLSRNCSPGWPTLFGRPKTPSPEPDEVYDLSLSMNGLNLGYG